MKKLVFFILFSCSLLPAWAQTVTPVLAGSLPSFLSETSGLENADSGRVWTHNDSGGDPELYLVDSLGNFVRSVFIGNATNIDWEELAKDTSGWIYIGDFGNNGHNRSNLRIFRIPDPDLFPGDTLSADTISFSYPDQTAFPPPAAEQNFDMEAMIASGDSLYLFSKNWTDPFTGFTKLYRLPKVPGTYVAELVDSFYTGPGPDLNYFVTAADISPDGKNLMLLGQDKCWLFNCYSGHDFFSGRVQQLNFPLIGQREAVVFKTDNEVYITDEELFAGFGGNLYTLDLRPWSAEPIANLGPDTTLSATSYTLDPGVSGMQYSWDSGDTSQTLIVDSSGVYTVEMQWNGNCRSSDTVMVTFTTTSVEDARSIQFENDGKGNWIFREAGTKLLKWRITDLHGRLLRQGTENAIPIRALENRRTFLLEIYYGDQKEVMMIHKP